MYRSCTVAAYKDNVDQPGSHQAGSHVVTLDSRGDACRRNLERCESGSLKQRSGLVAVDMHVCSLPAMLQRNVHRRSRRSILGSCQCSGIAVRLNPHRAPFLFQILQQAESDLSDIPADLDILRLNSVCLMIENLLNLRNAPRPVVQKSLLHPVQCPEKIDSCRSGGGKVS